MKKTMAAIAAAATALGVFAISPAVGASDRYRTQMSDKNGNYAGTVTLFEKRGKVSISADLIGLKPGFHGFHIHETGICTGNFGSAKSHFGKGHHGSHAGDLPNLLVNSDGTARLEFDTDRFALDELSDEDGSALIIHDSPDNHAHIPAADSIAPLTKAYYSYQDTPEGLELVPGPNPATTLLTGDAGPRAACGVVVPPEPKA